MLETDVIGERLRELGFGLYSGVPCSFLNDLINYALNRTRYIGAANEGDAVAICAGAWLGGKKAVVLMQNSGLANAVSPLTSLNAIARIPVLGFVSLRGEPGLGDEPQHELMGRITTRLLDTMEIPWEFLSLDQDEALLQIGRADAHIGERRSFFFVVKKNTFAKVALAPQAAGRTERAAPPAPGVPAGPGLARADVLRALVEARTADTAFIATTGFTGRELHDIADLESNFYMVGSMGCASSIGLGLAIARPDKQVICLDGDGAALMRLGALATNGCHSPPNLLHILLDNGCHESTGGQLTVSANVDWLALAAASGYRSVAEADSIAALQAAVAGWQAGRGPAFVRAVIRRGTLPGLSRPKHPPHETAARFACFLARTAAAVG